jgi:hypothetical protein
MLLAAIKSALVLLVIMLVQHIDEIWRGGISFSWSYLTIVVGISLCFAVVAYQFHRINLIKNPAYQIEWLYSPIMYIAVPVLLIVVTLWRG